MRTTKTYARTQTWKILPALVALFLGACSSSERSDLILLNVDLALVPTTTSMKISVLDSTTNASLKEQTVATPTLSNYVAKIALSQTEGMTNVVVRVIALNATVGLGEGISQVIPVVRGKNTGPVLVTVRAGVIGTDAGIPDATWPMDSGAKDSGGADAVTTTDGTASFVDVLTAAKLDAQAVPDIQDGGSDILDTATTNDSRFDTTSTQNDTAIDLAAAPTDTSPDGASDAARDAGTNILSTMNECKRYIHYPDPPATCTSSSNQHSVMLTNVIFTPDGNYLITAGNNSWVKLWKVVGNTLEDTKVIFIGDNFKVNAALSPSGDILALVNQTGNVDLYDLKLAIKDGLTSKIGTLLANKLKTLPDQTLNRAVFTSDGKQLVVLYPSQSSMSDTLVAVWDVTTQTLVREFAYNYKNWPFWATSAPSTGPVWVALGLTESVPRDAGSAKRTTMMLEDVSGTTTVKPTFIVPGEVKKVVWSADFKTLAIGTAEGEVSQWDLSNKDDIQRVGSPLIPATTVGSTDSVFALGYSNDGLFLASGSWIYAGPSTLRVINLQSRGVIQKPVDFEPQTFAFHPDGTTWAYGLGGCGYLYFCKN